MTAAERAALAERDNKRQVWVTQALVRYALGHSKLGQTIAEVCEIVGLPFDAAALKQAQLATGDEALLEAIADADRVCSSGPIDEATARRLLHNIVACVPSTSEDG